MHYYRGSPSKPPYICIHLHCLIPRKNGSESHLLTPKTNTSGKSQFFNVPFFQEIWFSNGLEQTPPGHWKTSTSWPSPTLPKVSFLPMTRPGFARFAGESGGVGGKSTTIIMEDPQRDGSETHKPNIGMMEQPKNTGTLKIISCLP